MFHVSAILLVTLATISAGNFMSKPSTFERNFVAVANKLAELKPNVPDNPSSGISSFHVISDIRYRYARTHVTSRLKNGRLNESSEVTFQMVLSQAAFVSKFYMEIDGVIYQAYVKEKEEAKREYNDAKSQGLGAGLVEINARHSNIFSVNVNIESKSTVVFHLLYEEFLLRKFGQYEHAINIQPALLTKIPDYKIVVRIVESKKITLLKVPDLRSDREVEYGAEEALNEEAVIKWKNSNSVLVSWSPSSNYSRPKLESDIGKFVVQYDINRDSDTGEILLMNGYFVHFFVPTGLLPLRKHVIYVLDKSGSMLGRKMEQMKQVMMEIMDDLKPDDFFNIITFSSQATVWNPLEENNEKLIEPMLASEFSLRQAHSLISSLSAHGGTNIDSALEKALEITSRVQWTIPKEGVGTLPENVESIIMFLTDGEPTNGVTKLDTILTNTRNRNKADVPIFTIAFGSGADFNFMKAISAQNKGFARKIYEAGDAGIQIGGFYREISSPLLSNITFTYTTNGSSINKLTQNQFPNIFTGSEIVVAGALKHLPLKKKVTLINESNTNEDNIYEKGLNQSNVETFDPPLLTVDISANGREGRVSLHGDDLLKTTFYNATSTEIEALEMTDEQYVAIEDKFLERLWAYITIKQLLEVGPHGTEDEEEYYIYEDFGEVDEGEDIPPLPTNHPSPSSNETAQQRALRLSLKYGFVTPITSLVVVKPNSSSSGIPQKNTEEIIELKEALVEPLKQNPRRKISSTYVKPYNNPIQTRLAIPMASPKVIKQNGRKSPVLSTSHFLRGPGLMNAGFQSHLFSKHFDSPTSFRRTINPFEIFKQSNSRRRHKFNRKQRPTFTNAEVSYMKLPDFPISGIRSNDLHKIKWPLNRDSSVSKRFLTIGSKKYFVLESSIKDSTRKKPCTSGPRHSRIQGICEHLKDCVKNEFVNSYDTFLDNYFCPIRSSNELFVGVCCPKL